MEEEAGVTMERYIEGMLRRADAYNRLAEKAGWMAGEGDRMSTKVAMGDEEQGLRSKARLCEKIAEELETYFT